MRYLWRTNTNSHVVPSVLWHSCNSSFTTSPPKVEEKGIVGKHLRVILESNPKSIKHMQIGQRLIHFPSIDSHTSIPSDSGGWSRSSCFVARATLSTPGKQNRRKQVAWSLWKMRAFKYMQHFWAIVQHLHSVLKTKRQIIMLTFSSVCCRNILVQPHWVLPCKYST